MDDAFSITTGDVASRDGVLVQVGGHYTPQDAEYSVLDAENHLVLPGLVQSHVHMCQTLARGRADNLELLDWLHQRVWPYEGALDRDALAASAKLSCLELLTGGTTSILDMGTVHHTDALFEAAQESGLRATIGKAMMDEPDPAIPPGLREYAGLDREIVLGALAALQLDPRVRAEQLGLHEFTELRRRLQAASRAP